MSNSTTGSYSNTGANSSSGGDSTYMSSQSAGATETDTSDGSIDNGVTSDNYTKKGNETDTNSFSSSFDATASASGTTSDSHGKTTSGGQDVTTLNEFGDYSTEPPGTSVGMLTPDNPNGYATSDQTIIYDENVTDNVSQQVSAEESGANFHVSGSGSYTAAPSISVHSDGTVSVNVAQNKDTQSGDYTGDVSESQSYSYTESGNASSLPYMSEV